jgi:hypothetical protein
MADFVPLTPAEMQVQQAAIDRQRALAQYLQQASLQVPEGQMVSGHYVAPSWTQYIAKLAQGLIGKNQQSDLDQKQIDLAKQQGDMLRAQFGIGNQSQQVPIQAAIQQGLADGAQQGDVGPTTTNLQRVAQALQAPAQSQSAYGSRVLQGMDPLQAFQLYNSDPKAYDTAYLKQFEPTDMMKNNRYMGISAAEAAKAQRAEMAKKGYMEAQPGNTIVDPITLKPVYTAPDFKTGLAGSFDAQGNPTITRIAGSEAIPQIAGETKRAEAGAQADYDMVTVNTPQGPRMMTRAQARDMAVGSGGPQGLDLSRLSPEQQAYLAKINPQAFANGVADFQRTATQPQPNAQGIGLQSDAQKEFQTAQAKNAATAAAALNERVRTGEDLMARLAESRDAMTKFQAGAGKETRLEIAKAAQALGMPDATVNKIAGGDIGAMQEFQKLSVTQAMEALKQAMATDNGQGGRMTQAEFQQFLKVNPNLSTDPRAIEKLYAFAERVHQRNLAEQQAFDQWVTQGQDPARWPAEWARRLQGQRLPAAPAAPSPAVPVPQAANPNAGWSMTLVK